MTPTNTSKLFSDYFTPNPLKHGWMSGIDGNNRKIVKTLDEAPVTLDLVANHLNLPEASKEALGQLPGTETHTANGVLDLDLKNYPEPGSLFDTVQRVLALAESLGLFVYQEESTRGGFHLHLFSDKPLRYNVMRDALKSLAELAELDHFETYPAGTDASSTWLIMPYAGAANDPQRLGRTFLVTPEGEAIPYDELDEWISRSPHTELVSLALMQKESFLDSSPSDLLPEAFDLLKEVALNPPESFNRHPSLKALLNLAARCGKLQDMLDFLKLERVWRIWIKDNSRTLEQWREEIDRWAKAKANSQGKSLGIKYLLSQGFTIPDLPVEENLHNLEIRSSSADVADINLSHLENFPELDPAIYHGLVGDILLTLSPHTEAHPAGLLSSFFVALGIALGNTVHWLIGGTQHSLRFNCVLVGATAKGRKGTSYSAIKPLLELSLGQDFIQGNVTTGLSSGEGLIYAVRDETTKQERDKKTKEVETVVVDPGIVDKRLVVLESEFGRVLKAMSREGNTLSAVVRQAWDIGTGGILRVMTKNSVTASGAHVGIIGHITRDELMRYLEDTETANGFANRFMWVMVKRERYLPFGGSPDYGDLLSIAQRLKEVVTWLHAQNSTVLTFADSAKELWARVYPVLSDGESGLSGAILSRSEPHVLRLAGLYAVLDKSLKVEAQHFKAALAFWEYCESSVKGIFGKRTGDTVADAILEALQKQSSLSKTDISSLFNRNVSASRINTAIEALIREGKASIKTDSSGKGRPVERLELSHG